jgi:hypothetical protein
MRLFLGQEEAQVFLLSGDKVFTKGLIFTCPFMKTYTNWESGNLSSITTTPRGTYNSDYRVSNIANDYSLDLNTLAQWIDDRENYTTVMNTFGQMAEILGKRSANILEDTYYIYDYSFRQDGRLKDMTLMGGSENIGYSFRFSYADDTEVSE